MLPKKEFYFLRHGQTDYNLNEVITPHDTNCPLNATGIQQASLLKSVLPSLPIQTICHSPLTRVIETMHFGTADLSCARIKIDNLSECPPPVWYRMTAPNQEKLESSENEVFTFYERALDAVSSSLSYPGPVLIIAHGGLHWALCHQLNISNHDWILENCGLVHFTPDPSGLWTASLVHP